MFHDDQDDDQSKKNNRKPTPAADPNAKHEPAGTGSEQKRDEYVGKYHPPKSGQFQPGKSGNPKGRPKKPKERSFATELKKALSDKVIGSDGRKHSLMAIAVKRVLQDLTGSNSMARKRALETIDRFVPAAFYQEVKEQSLRMYFVKSRPLGPGSNVKEMTDEEEFEADLGREDVRYESESVRRERMGEKMYWAEYGHRLTEAQVVYARRMAKYAADASAAKPDDDRLKAAAKAAEIERDKWESTWANDKSGRNANYHDS